MTDSLETETPASTESVPVPPNGSEPVLENGEQPYVRPELTADDAQSKAVWILVFVGLLGLATVLGGIWLALTIVALFVIITIHELGHYLTAKWSGMKVTEFFLGFGPRLWSFRRGETDYGVKPIMAGAYVRIVGMNNLDEVAPEDESRSYRQQSFPKRLIVVLAGPATHFVMVGLLFFILLAFVGVPAGEFGTDDAAPTDWVVQSVTADSAAENAGLELGDKVVAFDGTPVSTFKELTEHIRASKVGETVSLTVLRGGEEFETSTAILGRPAAIAGDGQPAEGSPFLGVGEGDPERTLGVFEAIAQAPRQTVWVSGQAISALGQSLSLDGLSKFGAQVRDGADDESEPASSGSGSGSATVEDNEGRFVSIIGVARMGQLSGEAGVGPWILILIMINVFLGLLNLAPLLPFDGGHAVVAVYERIRSRNGQRYHADVAKLLPVAYAVVMALIFLGVTTMYLDIVDPIN